VVGAAKDDARAGVGHQARVDGVEAGEEGAVPRLGVGRRLGVDVLAWPGQNIVEARRPVGNIIVVDRALSGGLLLLRSGHFIFYGRERRSSWQEPGINMNSRRRGKEDKKERQETICLLESCRFVGWKLEW